MNTTTRLIKDKVVQLAFRNCCTLITTVAAATAAVTIQVPQRQVIRHTWFFGKSNGSMCRINEGKIKRVAIPDTPRMAAMKMPTVLYGTKGANSSGVKPMATAITLRTIARAGSSNMTG